MNENFSVVLVVVILQSHTLSRFQWTFVVVDLEVNGTHFIVAVTPIVVLDDTFDVRHFWHTSELVSVQSELFPFWVQSVFDVIAFVDFVAINVKLEVWIGGAAFHAFVHDWKVSGVDFEGERHFRVRCVCLLVR